jgi:P-type E1-E2 ATPase
MREKQFMKNHKEILNEECMVIRGQYGTSMSVKCTDIVVGDIIQIETGMKVPADCVIFEGLDITVDERIYNDN